MDDLTHLALRAGGGDRRAMEAFVRAATPDVWRLCRRLGDAQTVDDLTQDTFARAIRSLPSFRGESSARTWILAIARRVCADEVRRRSSRRRLSARLSSLRAELAVEQPGTAEADAMYAVLERDRREAFLLTQEFGLSYAEAAAVCGCAVGTIRSRVARARHDLLRALDAGSADSEGPGDAMGVG